MYTYELRPSSNTKSTSSWMFPVFSWTRSLAPLIDHGGLVGLGSLVETGHVRHQNGKGQEEMEARREESHLHRPLLPP